MTPKRNMVKPGIEHKQKHNDDFMMPTISSWVMNSIASAASVIFLAVCITCVIESSERSELPGHRMKGLPARPLGCFRRFFAIDKDPRLDSRKSKNKHCPVCYKQCNVGSVGLFVRTTVMTFLRWDL